MLEQMREIQNGNVKALARAISFIENEHPGYEVLLRSVSAQTQTTIIGVTGPPGAGKSTLTDGLIADFIKESKRVAVLCIDPSSPFNLGALLGDRIRMSEWYNHPQVFIRSLASRGSMGGLTPKTIEITDLIKSAGFDKIIIETVGVGQSEIEIAGLADITIVVMVPESGDEVQTMKAGLMEIADVFVINKSDRPGADLFEKNLRLTLGPVAKEKQTPIIKTIATERKGIHELAEAIKQSLVHEKNHERHLILLTEKVWQLLVHKKMKGVNKADVKEMISASYQNSDFNLYRFVENSF
jgi:LAO/AO transport system kinase